MAVRFQHERLLAARVELGLTQEQAARVAGVDVRTYRRYESGEVNAGGDFTINRASRAQIVHKLASELGIDERELVVDTSEMAPASARAPLAMVGHVLPRAIHFVGREQLLDRLRTWAERDATEEHVITIVGVGGAGKTSLAERALAEGRAMSFVWSFYEDPRVDAFLDALIARLGGTSQAGRGELVDRATLAVEGDAGVILLLDGLEAIQARGDTGKAVGELEDARMRLFLRHLARGLGRARALITSRAALADLAGWEGTGATTIALAPLSPTESVELLRRWGVRASRAELASAIGPGGGHALSITMMGSYVSTFLGGRLASVADLDLDVAQKDDAQARRLAKLLHAYGDSLSALDRDVLRRICAFASGVSRDALARMRRAGGVVAGELGSASTRDLAASVARLGRAGLTFGDLERGRLSAHPFVRAHFRRELGPALPELHRAERAELLTEIEGSGTGVAQASLDTLEGLLEHTLQAGDVDEAFELYRRAMGGFGRLGLRLGELSRGLRVVRAFTREAGGDVNALDPALPSRTRLRLAYDWGLYAAALGDLPEALTCYELDASLARSEGLAEMEATALRTLAYTCRLRGELPRAAEAVGRSIALCQRASLVESELRGLALAAAIASDQGDLTRASAAFVEVRARGDVPVARRGLWEAEHLVRCGARERARALTLENLRTCEELAWRGHAAHCETLLGLLDVHADNLASAGARLGRAQAWCRQSGEVEMALRVAELEHALCTKQGHSSNAVVERGRELALLGGFCIFSDFI